MGLGRGIVRAVATGCYTGYVPFAPATAGTLLGVGAWWALSPHPWLYYPALALLAVGGAWAAGYYEREISGPALDERGERTEPPAVAVDELAGFMVAMISFPFDPAQPLASLKWAVLAFIAFRIFDTCRPYPVSRRAGCPGGAGIMLDDVLAGLYANLLLQFIRWEPVAQIAGGKL